MNSAPKELETIKGMVEDIVFCNRENGYAVLEIAAEGDKLITAVGALSDICTGEEVVLHGF
ncbi:MAG: hypothetical protein RRZ93_02865, partial [Ruthenibacterium sp.]